jgi:hypothetical protein
LSELKKNGPRLHEILNAKAADFTIDLNAHFTKTGAPVHIQQCGSMMLFDFLIETKFSSLLFFYLRHKGVHILEGGAFFLTVAHTDEDILFVSRAIKISVMEMQQAEFLPVLSATAPPFENMEIKPPEDPATAEAVKFPLTESQTEIWIAVQMGGDVSCAFNEPYSLQLRGSINAAYLQQAVSEVIERHQALHLTFSPDGKYQHTTAPKKIDVSFHDLSDLSVENRALEFESIFDKEASTPFDLVNGPLVHPRIFKLSTDDYLLSFYVHHIICDGWSSGILLHEFGRVYSGLCRGERPTLPEPVPFSRYVDETTDHNYISETRDVLQYWMDRFLETSPVLELPADNPRPAVRTYNGGTVKHLLSSELCRAAKMYAASHNTTLFVTLLAAFKVLLSRLTGQEDLVVGINVAGQAMSGMENVVGHCVNMLPLRSRLDPDSSFTDFLKTLRGDVMDAYEHSHCSFGSILRSLKLERDPGRAPLVEAIFNLSGKQADVHFDGVEKNFQINSRRFVHVDTFINIMEAEDGLTLDWEYNTDIYNRETIQRWINHYETLVGAIVDGSGQTLSTLPILSPEERKKLLMQWNENQ